MVSEHAQQVVHFHAEVRRLRGQPDAVVHRSGLLTGYSLESLIDASRGAGRVDLTLDADPDPETLAWLQKRLGRAVARGVRVFVSRAQPDGRIATEALCRVSERDADTPKEGVRSRRRGRHRPDVCRGEIAAPTRCSRSRPRCRSSLPRSPDRRRPSAGHWSSAERPGL